MSPLPLLTRALIVVSTLLREWGWLMVLAIVGAVFAGRAALRDNTVKRRWDDWLLRLWADTPQRRQQRHALDQLRKAELQITLPELGSTLQQLRSMRDGKETP